MRAWFLPYAYLDMQRLVSQHNEVHGLTTVILKGNKWGQISEQFRYSLHYLEHVHQKCVDELAARAIRAGRTPEPHTTHYPEFPGVHRSKDFKPTREDLHTDVIQLRSKWEAEGYYFGMGRLDLRQAERQLGIEPGREWKDCYRVQAETRAFIKENREQLKAIQGDLRLWQKLEQVGYKPK